MAIFNRRLSLSTSFLIFILFTFSVISVLLTGSWLQLYNKELDKKHLQLADESARIQSVLSDTMDYITQYTTFIGEKIVQYPNPRDLNYIAGLISGSADTLSTENKFYFTTTFDWVTPDKMLRVSNKIGVLPKPFDMSERDYLKRTPLYPWTLQLSKPRLGGLSKQWIVPAGMGITNEQGKFLGSITLGFSLKGLEYRIKQTLGQTDVNYLVLTDDMKPVLDSSIDNSNGPDTHFELARLDTPNLQTSGYLNQPFTYGKNIYTHYRKLPNYPYIILSGYRSTMAQTLFNEIVLSRGLIMLGIICTIFSMAYWMRRRFIEPVMTLAAAADRIRQGKQVIIKESPIQELTILGTELQKISDYIQKEHRINEELNQKTKALEIATKEALQARDSALKASQAKSEFLANMSHELRTPLNAIVGLINVMLLKQFSPERQKEYLETMQVSSQTLLELINNLLDLAKIESEHIQLEKISFNLSDTLDEVVRMLSVRAQEKKIALKSHYDSSLPSTIIGDPTRIKQILINLVSNAIKFTEHGHVSVNVSTGAKTAQAMIEIEVIDTGIGIASDKLETIFDKFSQADSSITRKYGGTGLGLALTKTLVECMGGAITAQSQLGYGSTFSVSIPLITSLEQDSLTVTNESSSYAPFPLGSKSPMVLLVEDHKPNILVTTNLLESMGCRYEVACNGTDAIVKARAPHLDLILMDVQMPDMDGFSATKIIRMQEKERNLNPVPIIGLTAYALSGDKEKCLEAGMNDYLSKPIDIEKFNDLIQRYVGTKYTLIPYNEDYRNLAKKVH